MYQPSTIWKPASESEDIVSNSFKFKCIGLERDETDPQNHPMRFRIFPGTDRELRFEEDGYGMHTMFVLFPLVNIFENSAHKKMVPKIKRETSCSLPKIIPIFLYLYEGAEIITYEEKIQREEGGKFQEWQLDSLMYVRGDPKKDRENCLGFFTSSLE
jgi:hypothetical protein